MIQSIDVTQCAAQVSPLRVILDIEKFLSKIREIRRKRRQRSLKTRSFVKALLITRENESHGGDTQKYQTFESKSSRPRFPASSSLNNVFLQSAFLTSLKAIIAVTSPPYRRSRNGHEPFIRTLINETGLINTRVRESFSTATATIENHGKSGTSRPTKSVPTIDGIHLLYHETNAKSTSRSLEGRKGRLYRLTGSHRTKLTMNGQLTWRLCQLTATAAFGL